MQNVSLSLILAANEGKLSSGDDTTKVITYITIYIRLNSHHAYIRTYVLVRSYMHTYAFIEPLMKLLYNHVLHTYFKVSQCLTYLRVTCLTGIRIYTTAHSCLVPRKPNGSLKGLTYMHSKVSGYEHVWSDYVCILI